MKCIALQKEERTIFINAKIIVPVLDNINIFYDGSDEIKAVLDEYEGFIKAKTLAKVIERVTEEDLEKQDLNGQMTGIRLERI